MCVPCQIRNNSGNNFIAAKPNSVNCTTEYAFLIQILNSIDIQMSKSNTLETTKLLNYYKGQVVSGINLGDYCYFNFQLVKTLVDELIQRNS